MENVGYADVKIIPLSGGISSIYIGTKK
jgi:hypothetical protein